MNSDFALNYRESNKDLHVRLTGAFQQEAASALTDVLHTQYTGTGRVFLDVRHVAVNEGGALRLFRQCLETVPAERLLFKGELGFQLGRNGCRVLIVKQRACQCSGACTVCACAQRAQNAKGRNAEDSVEHPHASA